MESLMVGWTTFGSLEDAEKFGEGLVSAQLAACIQTDGPIRSTYQWEGKITHETEYRLTVKFPESNASKVTAWVGKHHPYDTPQWLACRAEAVTPSYLKWALEQTDKQKL